MIDFSSLKDITIPEGVVTSIMCGDTVLWQKKQASPYKRELAYLESTGTQWIETGLIFKYAPYSIKIKFKSTDYITSATSGYYIGAMNNCSRGIGIKKSNADTILIRDYSNTNTVVEAPSEEWDEVFVNRKEMTVTANGVTAKLNSFRWYDGNPVSYALFGTRRYNSTTVVQSGIAKCAIAYCQLFDDGLNLVRDFIPVLDWDDVPCMYDKVSGELFYNRGTGEFLYE